MTDLAKVTDSFPKCEVCSARMSSFDVACGPTNTPKTEILEFACGAELMRTFSAVYDDRERWPDGLATVYEYNKWTSTSPCLNATEVVRRMRAES